MVGKTDQVFFKPLPFGLGHTAGLFSQLPLQLIWCSHVIEFFPMDTVPNGMWVKGMWVISCPAHKTIQTLTIPLLSSTFGPIGRNLRTVGLRKPQGRGILSV